MKLFYSVFCLSDLHLQGLQLKYGRKKDGEFAGTCASQSPFLNKDGEPCGLCGKMPAQQKDCDLPHPQQN